MIWVLHMHAGSDTKRNLGRGFKETGAKQLVIKSVLFFINHDILFSIAPVPVFQSYTLLYLLYNLDQVA